MTDFGAAVVRACNRLGIVVDVAHGTYDLVKRAALVTSRPLILSQTSLSSAPGRHSRQISPDHARAVAQTGGVIGIWPPASIFATTRPQEGASIFGEDLISEKSLDEVILSYLAEDLDGPVDKK